MFRFVAFSDLHAHNWKDFCHLDGTTGLNSRLLDAVHCIVQIREYCISHDISTVVFLGDMFETKGVVPFSVFNPIYAELTLFKTVGIHLIMLVGNHDLTTRACEIHAMQAFKTFATVVDKPTLIKNAEKSAFLAAPFTYDINIFNQYLEILQAKGEAAVGYDLVRLLHCDCAKAKVESGFIVYHDIKPDIFKFADYCITLMGHYHMHQWVHSKACYVGSTQSCHIGEANVEKGFVDVTVSKGACEIKFVKSDIPMIRKVTYTPGLDISQLSGDYVSVIIPQKHEKEFVVAKRTLQCAHTVNVQVCATEFKKDTRIDISPDMRMTEALEKVIDSSLLAEKIGNLDKRKLKELGKTFLTEAVEA